MPSYLLDKNIARRIIEALYHLDDLSDEEVIVLELWRQLQVEQVHLFIPAGAVNILQRFTLDQPFLRNFQTHQAKLQTRLKAMTSQLQLPYDHATLPKMLHPKELIY